MATVDKADPSTYTVTPFSVPDVTSPTVALAINNHGEITGYYSPLAGQASSEGFVADVVVDNSGTVTVQSFGTIVDPIAPTITEPRGLDDFGNIVGAISVNGTIEGFVDDGGNFVTVTDTLASSTGLYSTNDSGDVVGYIVDSAGNLDGYAVINGAASTITPQGDGSTQFTYLYAINNADVMAGSYYDDLGYHGFIDDNGAITTIDEPNDIGHTTQVFAINNNGEVSGSVEIATNVFVPFVYENGTYTEYDDVQVQAYSDVGINDLGELVGRLSGSEDSFVITPNGIACYRTGTRILTPSGEMPIEDLRIGDLVTTLSGGPRPIRWIGRRSYDSRFVAKKPSVLPILIRAGALADNIPTRDLQISPKHAVLLDRVLVPAEVLVNGVSIKRIEAVTELTYIHLELDCHDILLAEGTPAETFVDCNSRTMFQNAHEFAELYPEGLSADWTFCAERLEDGEQVEAIRQALAARAGIAPDGPAGSPQGHIDILDHTVIGGWAFDPARPRTPVRIEILVDGLVVATAIANSFREDLLQAKLGDGRCAFTCQLAAHLSPGADHVVQVRRIGDHATFHQPANLKAAA